MAEEITEVTDTIAPENTQEVSTDVEKSPESEVATPETNVEKSNAGETVPEWLYKKEFKNSKNLARENAKLKEQINGSKSDAIEETQTTSNTPNWDDYQAQGKTVEEYNNDYVNHLVEKGVNEGLAKAESKKTEAQKASDFEERQAKAYQNVQTKTMATRAAHADFDKVLEAGNNANISFSPEIELLISENENAGELFYNLVKDHGMAYKIMGMPYEQAVMELGRFSAGISAVNNQQDPNLSQIQDSPTPLDVGGSPVTEFSKDMSDADFDRLHPLV